MLSSRTNVALLIGVAVFTALAVTRSVGWLAAWEMSAFDSYLRLLPPTEDEPVVTMVWVTEREIQELGHPLDDHLVALVLENLARHGPRAIGIDIYRDRPTGDGWDELAQAFASHPQIVVVEKRPDVNRPGVGPPSFLPDRGQVGFADLPLDRDGVQRRAFVMIWQEEDHFVSFSLQLALRFLFAEGITMGGDPDEPTWVRLGETPIPPMDMHFGSYRNLEASGYQYLLDFRSLGGLPELTFQQALDGEIEPSLVRDRVVVIGTASPSVKDDFRIPSGIFLRESHVYGAAVHASAVDQLVRYGRGHSQPITGWSEPSELVWILVWCLLGALLGVRVQATWVLVGGALLGSVGLVGGGYLAFLQASWVPIMPAVAGWLSTIAVGVTYVTQQERADRRMLEGIFGKFLSPKLAESLWENRDIFWHGDRPRPQRATATILLSDLFGYTTRSEKAEAGEVMEWLGTYTQVMTDMVEAHDGMVHDFLGDGLMASFGLPFPHESEEEIDADAVRAVECALAMGAALEELNEAWTREGQPTARLRVGILTGPVVVGAIGGSDRMKYAAVGNTVNTAARLEAFDKLSFENETSTCRVLVGQATLDRLGGRFETQCLGDHVLKGKGEAVTIHRVLGRSREVPLAPAAEGA